MYLFVHVIRMLEMQYEAMDSAGEFVIAGSLEYEREDILLDGDSGTSV